MYQPAILYTSRVLKKISSQQPRLYKMGVLWKHHVHYWASCTNQRFYKHFGVLKNKNNMVSHQPRLHKMGVLSNHHVDYWALCTNKPFYKHFGFPAEMDSQLPKLCKMGVPWKETKKLFKMWDSDGIRRIQSFITLWYVHSCPCWFLVVVVGCSL